jgi:hypothetical protein
MVAESQTLPDRGFGDDRRAYFEQRLFALSPLNLWLTSAIIYLALTGAYAAANAFDGGTWLQRAGGGYALDGRARVALILALVACVALAMQRYARLSEQADWPALRSAMIPPMAHWSLAFDGAALRRATLLGFLGGGVLAVVVRSPGVGPHDAMFGSARSLWFMAATLLLAVLFARGVELTRVGSAITRQAINEGIVVDLLHIDRLYGWARTAGRNSLTWFAVSASACLLFVSQVSPLMAAGLLGACALMGLWGFASTMRLVHLRIHAAKTGELDEVRGEITDLRARPGPEPETSVRLHSLLAYEARIAAVREWPFDQSILMRVLGSALILALPWFGQAAAGVLVEHLGRLLH